MGLYKSVDKSKSVSHVRKDDEVIVISGDDKGKRGKVIEVAPKEGKLIIDGVNTVSKHVKPRRQGEPGGIIKTAGPVYACKVLPYCSKCGKGVRVKEKASNDNKRSRVCALCGEEL